MKLLICYVRLIDENIVRMQKQNVRRNIFCYFVRIEQNYLYQQQERIDISFFIDLFLNTFIHSISF